MVREGLLANQQGREEFTARPGNSALLACSMQPVRSGASELDLPELHRMTPHYPRS